MKRTGLNKFAFTLVELLIALMVSAIVLSAVVTLTFAMNTANEGTDDLNRFEAELRFATVRINDLVRYCKLITSIDSSGFYLWMFDKDNDGQIDTDEVVLIESDTNTKRLQMVEFTPAPPLVSIPLDIVSFVNGITGPLLKSNCNPKNTILIRNCSNIHFITDQSPPYTTLLNISFDSAPDGAARTYQINANLRCWAGAQLDENGGLNPSDDDGKIQ